MDWRLKKLIGVDAKEDKSFFHFPPSACATRSAVKPYSSCVRVAHVTTPVSSLVLGLLNKPYRLSHICMTPTNGTSPTNASERSDPMTEEASDMRNSLYFNEFHINYKNPSSSSFFFLSVLAETRLWQSSLCDVTQGTYALPRLVTTPPVTCWQTCGMSNMSFFLELLRDRVLFCSIINLVLLQLHWCLRWQIRKVATQLWRSDSSLLGS